ncbi:MAG: hypothetical protein KY444_11180 [Gemmatimonadetes bacterium]|nr:hypothetical protein [Gemmatimonadota bacterium]
MELVKVAENALTVELAWSDCSLLAHLCREALMHDALGDTAPFGMLDGYARTLIALFEAGGMATRAHTTTREEYTLEHFRQVEPVTKADLPE